MRTMIAKAVLLFSLLPLGACASSGFDPASSAIPVATVLSPPDSTTASIDFSNYQIGPNDEVAVEVFGAPELKREVQIDAAGNLSLPLVGTIPAGGKRPEEVSALIANQLRGRFLRDPQVTVNVIKASPRLFTVDGAVGAPGNYPIVGRMSLLQAIASAKGVSELADLDQVVIFRTVSNQKMAALFSLKQIRSGRAQDPQIYANDVVVVGENATRRFMKDVASFPILGRFIPFVW